MIESFQVQFTYDQVNPPVQITEAPEDVDLARNLNGKEQKNGTASNITESASLNSTESAEKNHEIQTRSLSEKNIFTRRGFYSLIESRLDS